MKKEEFFAALIKQGIDNNKLVIRGLDVLRLRKNLVMPKGCRFEDNISDLVAWCNNHPEITDLNLQGNDINDDGAILLSQIPSLKKLDLSSNILTDKGMHAFAINKSLIGLRLNSNVIRDEGAIELAKNTTLKELELYGTFIADKGAIALAGMSNLEKLDLEICMYIKQEGKNALACSKIKEVLYDL